MTTRKRNDFLDIASSDSEDNDRGYDSEAADESKARTVKRRKTQTLSKAVGSASGSEEDEELDVSEIEDSEEEETRPVKGKAGKGKKPVQEDESEGEDEVGEDETNEYGDRFQDFSAEGKGATKKTIDTAKLKKKSEKKKKSGVVYLSSLPPYLKPFALKSLLEKRGFGPITKVFLTPSTKAPSGSGRRSNKRKTFSEGWVEFESKKMAKICAETMNASIVGGRKGGWYHDDVLNLKYLSRFTWNDLVEQVSRERAEGEARRKIEDTRARKEDKVFLEGVEKGKIINGIQRKNEEKRRRKLAAEGKEIDEAKQKAIHARRTFRQNEVKVGRDKISKDEAALEADTRRILGKIF
ncbi:hypothetical protein BJY04DRAFT_25657 [Aspergillus karnatakaensis]|uniref:RNA-binding ATPase activator ESF2 n=1 Tax=Aspergillus karnatakaensis TaxID=1810916 RepID=UPI003CCCA4C3